jgi:hypothetical protein
LSVAETQTDMPRTIPFPRESTSKIDTLRYRGSALTRQVF